MAAAWVCASGCADRAAPAGGAEGGPSPSGGPEPTGAPDLERGRVLAFACAACHTFGRHERHSIGPNLHGVFGRPAATREGFDYSPALERSGIVWSPELLDRWLADPIGFVPGTTMAFTGYQRAADRRDLIAFLEQATRE